MSDHIRAPRVTRHAQWPSPANRAYGFPRGKERRTTPDVLAVVHITGNPRTARMPAGVGPGSGTGAEVAYMLRPGSDGPSAHTYIARDGAVVHIIDPERYAAWSNGDLKEPATRYPMVARMVKAAAKGVNPNELVYREYELTGSPGRLGVTRDQMESLAWVIARDSIRTGLHIVAGDTVGGHYQINTVDRASDPWADRRDERMEALCERAREIKRDLKDPEPEPGPEPEPDPLVVLQAALEAAQGEAERLEEGLADERTAREKVTGQRDAARDQARLAIEERDNARAEAALLTTTVGELRTALTTAEEDLLECRNAVPRADPSTAERERDEAMARLDEETQRAVAAEELVRRIREMVSA